MASLRSLGVHKPAALSYLVAESILSEDATEEHYTWETYNDDNSEKYGEEEVVTTDYYVVWSRGGVVRKVFNFEVEEEKIVQAILTWFPSDEDPTPDTQAQKGVINGGNEKLRASLTQGTQPTTDPNDTSQYAPPVPAEGRSRALVVILKSQAHVFFLSGSTHVVNLPFEVERAFPAPRGLILQRKIPQSEIIPPTPVLPPAPQNSFLSSQSFSQPHRRFGSSFTTARQCKSLKPGTTNALFLEDLIKNSTSSATDGLPRLFSFTNPLSELGLVVNVVTSPDRGSLLAVNNSSHRRLEPVEKAEELVYVSVQNEVYFDRECGDKPLILVVTANYETNSYTIWNASYIEPKSISSAARRRHSTLPASKVRRRSSYGPTAPGTGATTPALRARDGMRESFGGVARSKTVPASFNANSTQSKDKAPNQTAEDALASQLDPDFDLSRQPKESRRVSSLLSRAELSTSFDRSAFQDLATHRTSMGASFGGNSRRGQSFGGYADRNSFGGPSQPRNRASTPGSISRTSFGGASVDDTLEDIMDEDSYDTLDDYDEFGDIFASGGYGGAFEQEPMNGLRKELVMNKIAETPIGNNRSKAVAPIQNGADAIKEYLKVFTLPAPCNSEALYERRLFVHIVNGKSQSHIECEFSILRKRLSTPAFISKAHGKDAIPRHALIPTLIKLQRLKKHIDALKISDRGIERVLCLSREESGESVISLYTGWGQHLPVKFALGPLKLFNPYKIESDSPSSRISAGQKRTLSPPQTLQKLLSPGLDGTFDVLDGECCRHRLQLQLAPRTVPVLKAFEACLAILPNNVGDLLIGIWWSVCRSLPRHQVLNVEWTALVVALFSLAVPFIDQNSVKLTDTDKPSQKAPKPCQTTFQAKTVKLSSPSAWDTMWNHEATQPIAKSWEAVSWSWIRHSKPLSPLMSPPKSRLSARSSLDSKVDLQQLRGKNDFIPFCANFARKFIQSPIGKAADDQWRRISALENQDMRCFYLPKLLVALHLLREEWKLDILSQDYSISDVRNLTPILAQLGQWLQWNTWGWSRGSYYDLDGRGPDQWIFEESIIKADVISAPWEMPPSIFEWLNKAVQPELSQHFPTIMLLMRQPKNPPPQLDIEQYVSTITPRTIALGRYLRNVRSSSNSPVKAVEFMAQSGISIRMLETFPEAAMAPLREAIVRCQASPPTTWTSSLLRLVQREDLDLHSTYSAESVIDVQQTSAAVGSAQSSLPPGTRDVHTVCLTTEQPEPLQSAAEVERHLITRLIFSEDRRFFEAYKLLEPLKQAVAECIPDSRSEEAAVLNAQNNLMQWVMVRTFSLPSGSAMIKYNSKKPLLTEKYPLYGFTTSCLMKPMNNVVTADRSNYTEEKFGWAFFHAGVAAGLSISREAQGIDTSWIMYNKPAELTNKHAGLLLGLGLNGHLKTIAKWLSFKYLTPKHTMTSVGLLLGLSASYLGTMDTLVTRLLSVHVTRMLPPGAAELNLSPYTETTGLMGIGLLYYNTQHRRMSEIMLSEIEHVDHSDPSESPDTLRDEGYRLAAGFALGFINLGKGKDLRGLHDMRLIERLLAVAVGPKPVDIVHILDQATAGAVIAIALIFMKTHDEAVARKVDIPDTLPQFDYVRPDIFLLRTLAKHLIMWDSIRAEYRWITKNLPPEYQNDHQLKNIKVLRSEYMPFFNIIAGLLWSISLKYAGSGDTKVRDFLVKYLDQFIRVCRLPALRYDAKLTRNTVRNCQDLVALASATVMAGTGDLDVFRRLRSLHGRVGPDTPYGSHVADHMAFGALFIAGGTHTFSTSDRAIASLICAFYPIFPMDVQDNKAHLQAFRHFWVLATEPRCLVIRDVDTHRAVSVPIAIRLKNGSEKALVAPCLVPELDTIANIRTTNPEYWEATLDFTNNPLHLASFKANQTMRVRRRSAHDMHSSTFSATLVALNDAQVARTTRIMWDWLFALPAFNEFEKADVSLIIPLDPNSSVHTNMSGTVVDERLVLRAQARSWRRDDLWDLRVLFQWAERAQEGGGKLGWLGREVVERLRAVVLERGRRVGEVR
ncbi:negative regulator of mitosis [Glonium stellatum]|uniref:Negative regulator of mitosis n=1 Tax=Glonium stellatum TaxID=574774 RepID=A0A8E2JSI6_9PEZI|nr:negative regulator of mitosis [Glonium stellatum]